MKRRAKAKIKDFIILTVVFISLVVYFISACAIVEELYNYIIPFIISCCILWWFGKANETN